MRRSCATCSFVLLFAFVFSVVLKCRNVQPTGQVELGAGQYEKELVAPLAALCFVLLFAFVFSVVLKWASGIGGGSV